jgi:heme exporter protein B
MIRSAWWIVHKDLIAEWRAARAWPTMLLLGVVVALVFSLQMNLLPQQRQQMLGGLLWLAVFFAGLTAVDRSFAAEGEEGCWESLKLLPISPSVVYLAKMVVNFTALALLECLLIPLFFVLSDVPLLPHLGRLLPVAGLANLGLAAVGTLVGAMACGGRSNPLLVPLVLPLSLPIVLAAAECTRLDVLETGGELWWRWLQLLAAFAIVFLTAGTVLFEYAIED